MTIAELRAELGLTLEAFAQKVGLASKGQASQIERGEVPCSITVALKIEELSDGRVPASSLNTDIAEIEARVEARLEARR